MQVKKFEAPTIQEALETIKRELGPEAIILHTRKNRRGFGLMSKASVEITAAVSDRSAHKKKVVESRLPEKSINTLKKIPAARQAEIYDKYMEKQMERVNATRDRVEVRERPEPVVRTERRAAPAPSAFVAEDDSDGPVFSKPISSVRYADISDEGPRSRSDHKQAKPGGRPSAPRIEMPLPDAVSNGGKVEDELKSMMKMIEELKGMQAQFGERLEEGAARSSDLGTQSFLRNLAVSGAVNTPALQDIFEQLVMNGVDKRYALSLLKKVSFDLGEDRARNAEAVLDQLANEIMSSTEVLSPLAGLTPAGGKGPVVIALLGPTGVGKTTTAAKLASEALLKRNLSVGLINLDSYKVAAFDQLGTYAKILNVPFRSAAGPEDFKAAMKDFQSLDVVFVDTTGRSQRDPDSLQQMQSLLSVVPGIRPLLVLSVTTRDAELYDMATRFSVFRPQGIVMSKLDEATIYGAIYNVSQKVKLPLLYFTTGQRVPEDIEESTRERVAALILDI
ncbi:flagellar biosynthesis protein FlhF [Bdellovibrionota bacterium FG-2]